MTTDLEFKNFTCPADKKKVKLADGDTGGLFMEATPNGAKRWFWRYAVAGKVRVIALGSYCRPGVKKVEMPVAKARLKRDELRLALKAGTDPLQQRQLDAAQVVLSNTNTFEVIAREFHTKQSSLWSPSYSKKWLSLMVRYVFPWIGTLPIDAITVPLMLVTLRRVEAKGIFSTVQDLRESASQVFRYGAQTGRCDRNPADQMKGALMPHVTKHHAAIVDPVQAGALLRAIDGFTGQPTTKTAMLLSALTFQRPGNIRKMEWSWLDLDAAMLTIPAAAMKRTAHGKLNGRPHLVPLAEQGLALLKALIPLTGYGRFVFPSLLTGERSMSDNTVNTALRRLGFAGDEMTAHGFRAMARTMIAENIPGINTGLIEAQLAHDNKDPNGGAYDRAEHLTQRKKMMQTWADYLDQLRAGAKVIQFQAA